MKAKQLMLGNYALYNGLTVRVRNIHDNVFLDGGDESVEVVYNDGVVVLVDPCSLEPIPLTPEILEKNGFRHGCYVGGYYSPDCPFRVFTKTEGTCGFTTLFDDEIHFSCIFVHQLQNALSLCEIEKEITI